MEHNYEIHDTEMLVIIRGLEEWRHYLEAARHPVEIWTDHKNLEYFQVAQKLNCRQARWSLYLSHFNFTLHHKPGQSMGKPDALSRQANHGSGQGDNDNLTLLAPELFRIHALAGTRLEGEEHNILHEVQRSLRDGVQEEAVVKVARELRKDKGRGTVKSAEWSESDGLLIFCGKIYIPNDKDLWCRIIEQHHDTRIAGHAGCFKTLELVACNYWWPQMSRYISIYVKTCDLCNRMKLQHRQPFGELHPSETPAAPWDMISVDFIVELPESHGYDAIMNVIDSVTKRVHFIPMQTTITAEGAARLYLREVWKHHGTPQVVLSDRGSQFMARFTHELYKLLGIELATSMAYHSQTDGQTEHINQELKGYLRIFTSQRQDDWDDLLTLGEFSHNNNMHSLTQQTPFMVDTGRHPHMGFEPHRPHSKLESVNEFAECMAQGLEEAKSAIAKVKDEYAMYYNRRHEPAPVFKLGDRVWLDGSDIATNRPSSKLSHQRLGPFVVEACVGRGADRLALPPHFRRLHPVFPVVKLSIAHPDPIPGRRPAPPPPTTLINGEDEYEVEAVLDSRMCYNRLEYL
jgi:transposase InsO family protein